MQFYLHSRLDEYFKYSYSRPQVVSYRPAASPANQDIGNCLLADIKPDQLRDVGDVAKVTE